ncbi:CRISPR-associated protein Csx16 [Avibacterium sp. 21-586]|uniref:CRISPR-associated protein Csx16 n=1 Tax=Avibacterium sp. 21-586 TaxID=2911534 RepID=UPI00224783F1|nr:CRISPR-associated protein Csx16 [Avibacterium sp. 21-586]MCW9710126.1 CRISPR-associated protein Csx16 [Avibacterium sp. 21-586]
MAVWFISRHQGAIDWIQQQGIHIDHFIEHLDLDAIQAGDTVIGTLPIHLAAQVCEKEAAFYFLSVNVRFEQRGTELTAEELTAQGARLIPYHIQQL